MKRNLICFMIALMATSMAFVSCNKDNKDDSGYLIEVKNVQNTNDDINQVKAQLASEVLVDSKYDDGAFTLNLPKTVSNALLKNGSNDGLFGLIEIVALNKQKKMIGEFSYQDGNKSVRAYYTYANNNFNFEYTNKQETVPQIWNCSFTKGWNIIYAEFKEDETILTTQKPSGVNLKWYFFPNKKGNSQSNTSNSLLGEITIPKLTIK